MKQLMIDGKPVRSFLFSALTRVLRVGQPSFRMNVQVEGFDKDHAYRRACERWPFLTWEFIEELDAEHDIGMLGEKLPLNPLTVRGSVRAQ